MSRHDIPPGAEDADNGPIITAAGLATTIHHIKEVKTRKIYRAYDVFKNIADAGQRVRAAVSGPYVVVWPTPEPFMLPMLPRWGYVFTEHGPGRYTMRKYRVSADACKLPRKYRDILRPENYLQ